MNLTIKQKKFVDEYIISGNYGVVYLITNILNSKKYVGVTTRNIWDRFEEHCKADSVVGLAIRKYGEANSNIEIIDYAENHYELMYLEKEHNWHQKMSSFERWCANVK